MKGKRTPFYFVRIFIIRKNVNESMNYLPHYADIVKCYDTILHKNTLSTMPFFDYLSYGNSHNVISIIKSLYERHY